MWSSALKRIEYKEKGWIGTKGSRIGDLAYEGRVKALRHARRPNVYWKWRENARRVELNVRGLNKVVFLEGS